MTLHELKGHHKITVHQVRCVWAAGGQGSSGGGSTSGSQGGGGGSGNAGAGGGSSSSPAAVGDAYSVALGGTLSVAASGVLANDHGRGLAADLLAGPSNGSLTFNRDGSFSYTPDAGFSGVDHFTYKDTDASFNSSNPATVTITVTPLAYDDSYAASSGTPLRIAAPGVLGNDGGNSLSATLVSNVTHGTLALSSDGSFTYTPAGSFTGEDSFTYRATDGGGSVSNASTVTIVVSAPAPPVVIAEHYDGAVGNTPLQVADGSRQAGPELYFADASALDGDSDPGGGTLSTTPATITTTHGGSVVLNSTGGFIYTPPAGFTGPSDSFGYQVDASEGTSTQATATINFAGTSVWYVNASAASGGDGSAGAPFSSLAALAGASPEPGDVIYLYANAAPYAGGITLAANQSLVGSSAPLTVGSDTLLAASGGANPTITNGAGAGITAAGGDTIVGITVSGALGDGIAATTGLSALTIDSNVSVTDCGGDGLDIVGGAGDITDGAAISGSTGHSLQVSDRSGGTVSVTGAIDDDGTGISLTDNTGATINFTGEITANTGSAAAFTATGGGTVSATNPASTLATTTGAAIDVQDTDIASAGLLFESVSAGTSASGPADGVLIDAAGSAGGLSVTGTGDSPGTGGTIEHTTATGAGDGGVSVSDSGSVSLANMNVSASAANGVSVSDSPDVALVNVAVSGSAGDGLITADVPQLTVTGSTFTANAGSGIADSSDGTLDSVFNIQGNTLTGQGGTAIELAFAGDSSGAVETNTIGDSTAGSGSATGNGIDISDSAGTVDADINFNPVESIAGGAGISGEVLGSGTLNLTAQWNTVTMNGLGSQDAMAFSAAGSPASTMCLDAANNTATAAAAGAFGMSVEEQSSTGLVQLDGYTGAATDTTAVASFLGATNTLGGASGAAGASAVANATGIAGCTTVGGSD